MTAQSLCLPPPTTAGLFLSTEPPPALVGPPLIGSSSISKLLSCPCTPVQFSPTYKLPIIYLEHNSLLNFNRILGRYEIMGWMYLSISFKMHLNKCQAIKT